MSSKSLAQALLPLKCMLFIMLMMENISIIYSRVNFSITFRMRLFFLPLKSSTRKTLMNSKTPGYRNSFSHSKACDCLQLLYRMYWSQPDSLALRTFNFL